MSVLSLSHQTKSTPNLINIPHKRRTNSAPHLSPRKTIPVDQQISSIKKIIFASKLGIEDPNSIIQIKQLIQTHIIDSPTHQKNVNAIQKSCPALVVLRKSHDILEHSELSPLLKKLIEEVGDKNGNKTALFHQIVFDNLISPLILNNKNKTLTILPKLFSNSIKRNPSTIYSAKIKDAYQSLVDVLCPIKYKEFEPLVRKITFKEVTSNLRLFLDMNKILSKEFQGEFFDFVRNLRTNKTQEDFITHVKVAKINIIENDRQEIIKAIKKSFEKENPNRITLRNTIINILSKRISTTWTGMKWTYLECLQKQESQNE